MIRKRNYTIYTLNARELMRLCAAGKDRVDFNNTYERERILKEESRFAESALFYQIIRISKEMGDDRSPREIMTKSILYLDFERDITDVEESTKGLLSNGFEIKFRGDGNYTRFVPFDKSASMSRECTISFIREDLFDKVDEALDMGFRDSIEHFPSKYYAYRGLYMTDGTAVESKRMVLNEKTVIILRNIKEPLKDALGITVPAIINNEGKVTVNEKVSELVCGLEAVPYDGEGIISPEFAAHINRGIAHGRRGAATSFQIRMPFTKGMLHSVNFKKFITDQFPDTELDDLKITDYFGIPRSLKDAEIIMTDSMFKCVKWLEEIFGIYKKETEKGEPKLIGVSKDPIEYYFENFNKYHHALYIANTNSNIRGNKQVKMNYQFFNTLNLDKKAFEGIIRDHVEGIKEMLENPETGREAMLNSDDYADIDNIDSEKIKRMEPWEYALAINSGFIQDPMIKNRIKQAAKGQVEDILRGRVNVKGCVKYLSGDLLRFLINIAENCGAGSNEQIEELKDMCLLPDRFYVAGITGGNTGTFHPDKYYGVLRSPHLSRNEQCALRPYSSTIYSKYFGKLSGIVMVSDFSDAPIAMSGADFDGDMVKIIMDDRINNAIIKAVYEVDDERETDTYGVVGYKRALPVPVIQSPHGTKKKLGKYISYDDLRSSFSGRVGHISNLAIQIAKLEYSGKEIVPKNSAALCTIATGLEIDAVKNGASPDISYLENLCKNHEDIYLKIHNDIQNRNDSDRAIHVSYDEATDEYTAAFKYTRKKKDKKLFKIDGNQRFNIDYLPYFYAKAINDGAAKGRVEFRKESMPEYCFMFELHERWIERAAEDDRLDKLRGIIGAYRKLRADSWNIGRAESKYSEGTLRSRINTLLDVEYEMGVDRLFQSGEYVEEALETAYQEMYEIVVDEKFANEALEMMTDLNWQYTPTFEERKELLNEIIGTSDFSLSALEIICDTYDNGYQILNHMLRDVRDLRKIDELQIVSEEDEDFDEKKKSGIMSPWKRTYDKDLFNRLFEQYKAYYNREDYAKTDWLKDAAEICREEVLKLFEGDVDAAIECTVALGEEMDEKHAFLWNVYEPSDFIRVIYDERDKRSINVK